MLPTPKSVVGYCFFFVCERTKKRLQTCICSIKLDEQFDIYHMQYLNWPDFGEPTDDKTFLQFLAECHQLNLFSDPNFGPPIVHCSAGLGRSGTFALVNTCLELVCA